MKIWLPDQLYRAKPLILILLAVCLHYISENIYLSILSALFMGYGFFIMTMRILWLGRVTALSDLGSTQEAQHKPLSENALDK
jgi:hypothetical protein